MKKINPGTKRSPVKQMTSQEIQSLTLEFIKRGGKIDQCPVDATGIKDNGRIKTSGLRSS